MELRGFAFKLGYLINLLIDMELPIQYDEMLKQYGRLQKSALITKSLRELTILLQFLMMDSGRIWAPGIHSPRR